VIVSRSPPRWCCCRSAQRRSPTSLTDERPRCAPPDLAKGRTVAVNFIFTSCTTICSPMSGTFAKVETLLGKRDVRLISVTLDPETDTPARLAAWKKKFKGRAAWTLLTGRQEDIDSLGKALGVFTPDRVSHTPIVVVFNEANGRMTRVNGLANAQAILDAIDSVASSAEDRGRAMYQDGPRVDATVGDTMMSVPMACGGCHGSDGRGRTEGGMTAPEITWRRCRAAATTRSDSSARSRWASAAAATSSPRRCRGITSRYPDGDPSHFSASSAHAASPTHGRDHSHRRARARAARAM
jgi:protein SCO1/2